MILKSVILYLLLALPLAHCDGLELDEATRKLALNLFREFSNKTRLAELIANRLAESQLEKFPIQPVAQIYRNYTLEQIHALELELSQHQHYIYTPISEKSQEVKAEFGIACDVYQKDGDLREFEKRFIQTGTELVALQKMVIRIINSKLEERLKATKATNSQRNGRSNWFYSMFDRLNHLFLGSDIDASSLYKSSDQAQVNKVYQLIQALEKIEHAQPTDENVRQNVDRLRSLLFRLRKIYQLNQIASVPNMYLNTDNISPYNYEATLQLVQLLGTESSTVGTRFNPLMLLFRTWINFFNGGNIFAALLNPFGAITGSAAGSRPAKYDPQRIRRLMQLLEENERLRQQEIERNRQRQALENLIRNQNKQQQQITEVLNAIANNNNNNGNIINNAPTTRPPWLPTDPPRSTRWPPLAPQLPGNAGDVLKQLKDQRRHLNELLQELQKPMDNQTAASGIGSAVPPVWQPRPPSTGNTGSPPNAQQPIRVPSNRDIMQAQQSLMSIMKNITPLINMMGQSGLVSMPRLEQSKFSLINILNAANNRAIEENDEVEDGVKEIQRVEQLGEKLETVLDGIIDEAEDRIKSF